MHVFEVFLTVSMGVARGWPMKIKMKSTGELHIFLQLTHGLLQIFHVSWKLSVNHSVDS